MGYPIDSSYVQSSNVYHAHKLERPLMLVVGESFGEHKRFDFFVRNLMGVTPPKWNELK